MARGAELGVLVTGFKQGLLAASIERAKNLEAQADPGGLAFPRLDQSAISSTALAWDRNGELCSEDLERLLALLQARRSQNKCKHQALEPGEKGLTAAQARNAVNQKRDGAQAHQPPKSSKAT